MQSRRWVFTIHGERADLETLLEAMGPPRWGEYGMCQLEQCPETQRFHLQGFCCFPSNMRLSTVKATVHSTAHWEVMKGKVEDSENYCSKEETRVDGCLPKTWGTKPIQGRRTDIAEAAQLLKVAEGSVKARLKRIADVHPEVVIKYHRGLEALARLTEKPMVIEKPAWHEWQQRLADLLAAEPDDRHIVWVTDPRGGNGKSYLVRYFVANENAIVLNGKVADMAYAYHGERIVFFDVTRTQLENMDHLYSFAESLKNGLIFASKYESCQKVFKPPHVVFMANVTYARGKWSEDRVQEIYINSPAQFFSATTVVQPYTSFYDGTTTSS